MELVPALMTPGLFGRRRRRVGSRSVLGKVSGPSVLDLRSIFHELSIMSQLNMGLGSVPFALTASITTGVRDGCSNSSMSESTVTSVSERCSVSVAGESA